MKLTLPSVCVCVPKSVIWDCGGEATATLYHYLRDTHTWTNGSVSPHKIEALLDRMIYCAGSDTRTNIWPLYGTDNVSRNYWDSLCSI